MPSEAAAVADPVVTFAADPAVADLLAAVFAVAPAAADLPAEDLGVFAVVPAVADLPAVAVFVDVTAAVAAAAVASIPAAC